MTVLGLFLLCCRGHWLSPDFSVLHKPSAADSEFAVRQKTFTDFAVLRKSVTAGPDVAVL